MLVDHDSYINIKEKEGKKLKIKIKIKNQRWENILENKTTMVYKFFKWYLLESKTYKD